MKQAGLLLTGILFFFQAAGQRSLSLGIHGNAGNKNFNGNGGYGVDATFLIPAGPDGAIRLYSAYDRFPKAIGNIGMNEHVPLSFIALRTGYHKWLYSDNVFLYGELGISTAFRSSISNKAGFSYAFGTGYKLNVNPSNLLQFTISYNRNAYREDPALFFQKNYSWWSLGAAYGFKFGRRKSFRRDD